MNRDTNCVQSRKVAPKKTPETDAIFAQLEQMRLAFQADKHVLRLSMDAKAPVFIGDYARGGKTRLHIKAVDHDFQPDAKLTPYCIFLPDYDRAYLYFTGSRVTSDFIADCLLDCWTRIKYEFPEVKTLMLLQDNGPENHSRRTQFMYRLLQLADQLQLAFRLVYYPPYHSKYNPVERFWGVLEQHWNGDLLDSVDTVLNFAKTMSWNQQQPIVNLVHKLYHKGVRLSQKAMALLEQRFERLPGLEKYFVLIRPQPSVLSG
jgi:hypothetical protein